MCNTKVIPKALNSDKVSPHFAHVDINKCDSESMIHWWFKHKYISIGDSFNIETDTEIEYICKNIEVEKPFNLKSGIYKPDLLVYTECGETIVFEMAFTNKKNIRDYIDKWIELNKTVVEIDIKNLLNEEKNFKALFYKGKCFNLTSKDGGYYKTIGKLKEEMLKSGNYSVNVIKRLDWFWDEVEKYNNGKTSDSQMFDILDVIINVSIVKEILKTSKCINLSTKYISKLEKEKRDAYKFSNAPTKDSHFRTIVKELNKKYSKIDKSYKIHLHREAIHERGYSWFKGKKYQRVVHYEYSFTLFSKKNSQLKKTIITENLFEMEEGELHEYLELTIDNYILNSLRIQNLFQQSVTE